MTFITALLISLPVMAHQVESKTDSTVKSEPSRAPIIRKRIIPVDNDREPTSGLGLGAAILDDFKTGSPDHYLIDLEVRTNTPLSYLSICGNLSFGLTTLGDGFFRQQNWIISPKAVYHHEYKLRPVGGFAGLFLYHTNYKRIKSLTGEDINTYDEFIKSDSKSYAGVSLGADFNWRHIITSQIGAIIVYGMRPRYTVSFHLMLPN
ncbi:MAG: hypothetical protein ABIA63_15670 [bacterium]